MRVFSKRKLPKTVAGEWVDGEARGEGEGGGGGGGEGGKMERALSTALSTSFFSPPPPPPHPSCAQGGTWAPATCGL